MADSKSGARQNISETGGELNVEKIIKDAGYEDGFKELLFSAEDLENNLKVCATLEVEENDHIRVRALIAIARAVASEQSETEIK